MKLKTGSCICNNVKYTVTIDNKPRVYNCHCVDCRKKNGVTFVTMIELRKNALTIDQNKLNSFTHSGYRGKKSLNIIVIYVLRLFILMLQNMIENTYIQNY